MLDASVNMPSAMQAILVVWLAVAVERAVPISTSIDPLSFFRFVCQRMANKVLKTKYRGQQANISGGLALIVLVLPTAVIVYLIREFASYQWLLDVLLLWVLLQYNGHVKNAASSIQALAQDKKQLAKNLMQLSVLRQTAPLSPLGLHKAALECIFLRYNHQVITILFWYLLAGPVAALVYRLSYEASQIWSTKLPAFADFGRLSTFVCDIFRFIPTLFTSLSMMLFSHPAHAMAWLVSKQFWFYVLFQQRFALLQALACSLQITSSGPVMYEDNKRRYPRLLPSPHATSSIAQSKSAKRGAQTNNHEAQTNNHAAQTNSLEPNAEHLKRLISLSNRHLIISLVVVSSLVFWIS